MGTQITGCLHSFYTFMHALIDEKYVIDPADTAVWPYNAQVGAAMRFMIQDRFNRNHLLHETLIPFSKTSKGRTIFTNFINTAQKARAKDTDV